jgi:mono/diheme cytochrome c family protein
MLEWIGHFHPVLVHLPIGILLIAVVLQWLLGRTPHPLLHKTFLLVLFLGVLSAALSCLTGYLLSLSGDYDDALVHQHMYLAFALTVISLLWLWRGRKLSFLVPTGSEPSAVGQPSAGASNANATASNANATASSANAAAPSTNAAAPSAKAGSATSTGRVPWFDRGLSLGVLLLIMITGHLGGTLTHGEGYLTPHWGDDSGASAPLLKPIADVNNTVVYTGMVQPILHDYCYRCHGPSTQKGAFRMDTPELLMKGGKHGKTIIPNNASASELIKRILLPLEDEHHMAPKEKPQLTKEQIKLLSWWIDAGAPMDKKAGELAQDSTIKAVLEDFHKGSPEALGMAATGARAREGDGSGDDGPKNIADSDMPQKPVNPGSEKVINELNKSGLSVLPIASGSNYLQIILPDDSVIQPETYKELTQLKDQLVELKASGVHLDDEALKAIGQCTQLIRLRLDHASLGAETLKPLKNLENLRYLNLVGTSVTAEDILELKGLKNLKELYVFQTKVDRAGWGSLTHVFPQTKIDTGGYKVPLLSTDTQIVKAPVRPQ